MITPLGQRQMFQTINAEAVKAALEVHGQVQRELAQRQEVLERVAEDGASVPEVQTTEGMRTEERQAEGGRHGAEREAYGEAPDRADADDLEELGAKTADGHLDLLA